MSRQHIETERTLSQEEFDAFARLSGDDNPIHVDPAFSATSRFGRTVAHGMLLYAVIRGLLDRLRPGARQLSQDLMFPAPTFAGEAMRFSVQVESEQDGEVVASVSCRRVADNVVTCSGTTRMTLEAVAE